VILVGAPFWQGLLDWMEDKLVGEGMIAAEDMRLMQVIDEPQAIVEAIFAFYETKGFVPTREEREKMLNL
jgi:predicted Rossmann-fold nucleotide-binding protein